MMEKLCEGNGAPFHEGVIFTTLESRHSTIDLEDRWRTNILKASNDSNEKYLS